jgi:TP901-1 family phage major tail protein
MATVGIANGTLFGLYVGGTLVANGTSHSFTKSMEVRDATSKDSGGNSESLEGLKSWEVSGDFLFAQDAAYGIDDLDAALDARAIVVLRFASAVSADKYWNGRAYITEISVEAGTEESMTFSASFTGTGAVNYTTLT